MTNDDRTKEGGKIGFFVTPSPQMDEMSILTAASGHHARISMGKKWDPRESDDAI